MKIYFIGAGPGDPELLTIKAKEIIEKAEIIIYAGSLINKKILEYTPKNSPKYDSSKMTLEDVIKIFVKAKSSKKIIARIHSGDPSIYSSIQEQINWCEKEKVEYEIIPGVSSFCAGAGALNQELTLPGISQTVIITRISGRTKVPKKEDLKYLSKIGATLIIFLSADKIKKVIEKLLFGYRSDTPAAVVYKASWLDQKIIKGTLKDIVNLVEKAKIKRQALIYVGNVLKKMGFQKSKLYDKSFSHLFRK